MAAAMVVAVVLAACGGGAPPPAATGEPPPTAADAPGAATAPADPEPGPTAGVDQPPPDGDRPWEQAYGPPDPVDVSVELGQVEMTGRVTVEHGGFLSLLGAGGTFYQFQVPPEAVLSDVDVTMTEVASIGGSPLGDELVGAVAFEPEGLFFMQPAILTITPPTPLAVHEEGPFSAGSDGTDFHLYPLDSDPSVVRMHLMHFSLFGLFKTDAERRAEMISKTANNVHRQLEQELTRLYHQFRERSEYGFDENPIRYYRDRVLAPLLKYAEWNHTVFIEATLRVWAWQRLSGAMREACSAEQPELAEPQVCTQMLDSMMLDSMLDSWQRGLEHYFERTIERCYEHDMGSIIDLLKVGRLIRLLEFSTLNNTRHVFLERAEKCARFTVEMDSATENHVNTCVIGAGRIDESARLTATAEFQETFEGQTAGTGPMRWESAQLSASCDILTGDVARCTMKFAGFAEAGELTVLDMNWDLNVYTADAWDETEVQLRVGGLVVQPGEPQVFVDGNCEGGWVVLGGGGSDFSSIPLWHNVWHGLTRNMPCRTLYNDSTFGPAYYLTCWEYVGQGDELARWQGEASSSTMGSASEKTTFLLRHTPQR